MVKKCRLPGDLEAIQWTGNNINRVREYHMELAEAILDECG